jgi:uncharacterized repeat protein (TIGR01451 family)
MKTKLLLCVSLILQVFSAQSQEINWATSVSGTNYEYGMKAVQDELGNTFIIGYTTGTPFTYQGVSYPTNGTGGDAFFAKINPNNELVWMKSVGGDDYVYYDEALDIHFDPFGAIYLTFKSSGSNFTYNGQVLSGIDSNGQYGGEGVLLKVNSNGDYIWHDSGSIASSFSAVTTDASGNVYLTGYFHQSMTLGGITTVSNPSTGYTVDYFVAKYQSNGVLIWAKNAGGMPHNSFAYGVDIEINAQSNEVIVLGKGDGDIYFDGVPMPGFSSEAILLISYNLDGTQNWVKQILNQPNNFYCNGTSLDISPSGIIGVCGQTYTAAFIGFYTPDGFIISENTSNSTGQLGFYSIVFNEFNEAYISGNCVAGGVLGMSPGTATLSTLTGFIVKMDVFQQVKWLSELQSYSFGNTINYANGKLMYAGRIDNNFTYNSGQTVIQNTYGDALFAEVIDYQLPANRCNITGTIFQDVDADCVLDTTDVVQKSVLVKAVDSAGSSHFSISDVNGNYDIPVDLGLYTVEILPNPIQSAIIEQNCYTQQEVTLTTMGLDVNNINFPVTLANCPLLSVDLVSNRRRRCFESMTYVSYSNSGFATAQNVQVIVQFPEYVSYLSSNVPATINADGNYVFNVGTLAPNQSGTIQIVDITQCIDGITGQTQCTKAWITPANNCATTLDPNYGAWDKSTIAVRSICLNGGIVQFTISNTAALGIGDMQTPRAYRIFVDNQLALTSTYQLDGGDFITVDYPANGQTIRLEADADPLQPGTNQPQSTEEGCAVNGGTISLGFVNTMAMDDQDANVEIHCLEIIDSFDPNDKLVSPTGITANHYVKAGTVLDYMIRFQNTGTDTAYTVIIKDTLSPHLDPSTIQWGISSHPYSIQVTGTDNPVLIFTFNNIDLPHSSFNEPGSHGFVKFKAATYGYLENGVAVDNNAQIYFDYNLPIITNTISITISDIVLIYDPLSVDKFVPSTINVYPNPTSGVIIVAAENLQKTEIYALNGMLLETVTKKEIDMSSYAKGIYLLKVTTDKGMTVKKVVLK